ncbi:MAG: rhodanese-like domain-containing protein [Crocinitomicaceae bacterium]|nr:rhodanese-like domain-containing protein [Crocinitomicaceae bacterium]
MKAVFLIALTMFFVQCSNSQTDVPASENYASAFLVDVRSAGEYQGGSAGDAINIPVDDIQRRLAEFPKDKNAKIVVFCLSGGRSSHAKHILEQNGYTNVENGGTFRQVRAKIAKEKEAPYTKG